MAKCQMPNAHRDPSWLRVSSGQASAHTVSNVITRIAKEAETLSSGVLPLALKVCVSKMRDRKFVHVTDSNLVMPTSQSMISPRTCEKRSTHDSLNDRFKSDQRVGEAASKNHAWLPPVDLGVACPFEPLYYPSFFFIDSRPEEAFTISKKPKNWSPCSKLLASENQGVRGFLGSFVRY